MISRRILAAVAVLCALVAPAQAQKTKAQLNSEITTNVPDNTVGQITAAGMRAVLSDTVNSIMPTAPVVSGNLPIFNGTTGLFQDSGISASGINGNALNTQTSNYSIAAADCGKTVQAGTGSTGLFTVTLPSVSGFPATCSVMIKNGDSTRGKVLSGFPSDLLSNILWPNQAVGVGIVNGAWATLINPGKWSLAAAVNVFSDHANGSDTNNDCLGTGAGACATIQNALYTIKSNFNCGAFQATVQNANETFTENNVHVFGPSCDGEHPDAIIQGNPASPNSAVWQVSGNGNAGLAATDFGLAIVNGFKFVGLGTGDTALEAAQLGFVAFENIEFGTFAGGTHLLGFTGGIFVFEGGTYTVSGNVSNHISLTTGATLNFGTIAISVPNALTFINWATLGQGASANLSGLSFTGAGAGAGSTGKQYSTTLNASLFLNGISLPGASAGTATFGACTDAACASFPTTGLTGALQAAQEPAHTGDVTNTAGSLALAYNNVVPANKGGAGSVSGALKANGTGTVTQAACADLSNAGPGCAAAAGQLPGTATNDSASAGNVGQYIESNIVSGSAVSLTTGAAANLTSISLPAGDWEVALSCGFLAAATTNMTANYCSMSQTTGVLDLTNGRFATHQYGSSGLVTGAATITANTIPVRFSLSTTTTIFAVVRADFTVSTNSVFGIIKARRVR